MSHINIPISYKQICVIKKKLNFKDIKLTFGMLTLDQNNSKCSLIFSGLNFEYKIANSVNIPIWALSKPVSRN